jgi:phosphoribosylformylglycinamidine (FGAM) synthase-like amidotransferase family enzyme
MKLFPINLTGLLLLCIVLCGCPVSSTYPLGLQNDALPFDKALVGTWENKEKETEATLVKIEKGSGANLYKLTVLEKGESFMADSENFIAWTILLNEKKFLVLQEVKEPGSKDSYFVYHFAINGNQLTTNDISLKVNGTDAITSVKSYKEEVVASMKHPEFLAGKINWEKK